MSPVLALWLGLGLAASAAAGSIDASIDEGRLSLRAEAAPLAEVLQAIGEAGGFAVVLRGDPGQPVDRVIGDQPPEDALQELAKGHSLIIRRGESGRVAEIHVVASHSPTPALPATPGVGPGASESADLAADLGSERPHGLSEREAFRLANLGRPAPTESDIRFTLTHEDQTERVVAIPKVGALMPPAALGVLEDVLTDDEDSLVRSRAVAALIRFEGSNASGLLQSAALNDGDADIRIQALNALASSADAQRRTSALARALRADPEPDVRRSGLLALRRVGGDRARSYLERSAPDLEPELRQLAEQALRNWSP